MERLSEGPGKKYLGRRRATESRLSESMCMCVCVAHMSVRSLTGEHGGDVEHLQFHLNRMGLYEGKKDGWLGPKTAKAIQQFQKEAGISQTGKCDKATKHALVRER